MNRRTIETIVTALVLASSPVLARGEAAPRCDAVKIEASDVTTTAWTEAIAELRTQVAKLDGADCIAARVEITPAKDGVVLTIEAHDGRRAERRVKKPSHLVTIALGVLASIPEEHFDAPPPPSAVPPPVAKEDVPEFTRPPPAPKTIDARVVQLSLGAAIGGRYGAPTSVVVAEAEVRFDVIVQKWLVLATVRYAPIGARVRDSNVKQFGYDELAMGLGFGRRFDFGVGSLDLTLVPSIVLAGEEGIVAGGPNDDAVGDSHAYARIDTSARWLFGAPGGWRFAATLDADAAPSTLGAAKRVDPALPPIPSWTLAARLGAAGDLL